MEISIDVRARGSNSQPLDPEFDALDRSATDSQTVGNDLIYIQARDYIARHRVIIR